MAQPPKGEEPPTLTFQKHAKQHPDAQGKRPSERTLFDADAPATDADLVFPSKRKTVLNPSNVRNRIWKSLFLDDVGNPIPNLPYIRIHDLRHTFVTRLLQVEKDMVYAQQQARHASIRTTVDSYGHLAPGYNQAGVNKLDDPEEQESAGK